MQEKFRPNFVKIGAAAFWRRCQSKRMPRTDDGQKTIFIAHYEHLVLSSALKDNLTFL